VYGKYQTVGQQEKESKLQRYRLRCAEELMGDCFEARQTLSEILFEIPEATAEFRSVSVDDITLFLRTALSKRTWLPIPGRFLSAHVEIPSARGPETAIHFVGWVTVFLALFCGTAWGSNRHCFLLSISLFS